MTDSVICSKKTVRISDYCEENDKERECQVSYGTILVLCTRHPAKLFTFMISFYYYKCKCSRYSKTLFKGEKVKIVIEWLNQYLSLNLSDWNNLCS